DTLAMSSPVMMTPSFISLVNSNITSGGLFEERKASFSELEGLGFPSSRG
ncbi:hypothetical protein A2U01_0104561, partial [Trifolium medium]|nr:hypothetical protein [Trifolium medium]